MTTTPPSSRSLPPHLLNPVRPDASHVLHALRKTPNAETFAPPISHSLESSQQHQLHRTSPGRTLPRPRRRAPLRILPASAAAPSRRRAAQGRRRAGSATAIRCAAGKRAAFAPAFRCTAEADRAMARCSWAASCALQRWLL